MAMYLCDMTHHSHVAADMLQLTFESVCHISPLIQPMATYLCDMTHHSHTKRHDSSITCYSSHLNLNAPHSAARGNTPRTLMATYPDDTTHLSHIIIDI